MTVAPVSVDFVCALYGQQLLRCRSLHCRPPHPGSPATPLPPCFAAPQADTTLPPEQRRNYKNAFDALGRIVKDEGMKGLFTGAGPTVVRACALNMGMLASNDQVRCTACWCRRGEASCAVLAAGLSANDGV